MSSIPKSSYQQTPPLSFFQIHVVTFQSLMDRVLHMLSVWRVSLWLITAHNIIKTVRTQWSWAGKYCFGWEQVFESEYKEERWFIRLNNFCCHFIPKLPQWSSSWLISAETQIQSSGQQWQQVLERVHRWLSPIWLLFFDSTLHGLHQLVFTKPGPDC